MERWSFSLQSALKHGGVQAALGCALLLPLVATVGQYLASGYWWQSAGVEILFWPGQPWRWAVRMPVWLSMGAMLVSYVLGIAWLLRARTLSAVVVSAIVALVVANGAAALVNYLTGWRELQAVGSMDLSGKANRAIFALWHNPAWEEVVFRGIPLALLLLVQGKNPRPARWAVLGYYLVPSLLFAVYHVPGHGPSRLVDTFVLALAFAWMARRFTFFAPLVMHYVFDAVMTLSLARLPSISASEVLWLSDHSAALNSTWSVLLLLWIGSTAVVLLLRRYRVRRLGSRSAMGGLDSAKPLPHETRL